jgi:hypothetical protein
MLALLPGAEAVPLLQLYVEGGTYNEATESWVVEHMGDPIRLWVIGNVAGPGSQGTIYETKLAIAYNTPEGGPAPVFTVDGSTTGGYGGFTDPSTADDATYLRTVTDGSTPTLYDGSSLPGHGIYGQGTDWQEFALGDLDTADSPIADFFNVFPGAGQADAAQINVYEITIAGDVEWLHFDLYDHTASRTRVFAPPSHDADTSMPEPAAVVGLLTLGIGGLIGRSRLFRHTRKRGNA